MSIDQRGMKIIVQAEGQEFLQPQQLLLNHTVATIEYDSDGVTVTITNGTVLTADYALCTFSLGVLQNDDVVFSPKLPSWKVEAISSIDMVNDYCCPGFPRSLILTTGHRDEDLLAICREILVQHSSKSACKGYGRHMLTITSQDGPLC